MSFISEGKHPFILGDGVESHKFFCIHISSNLNWTVNNAAAVKKTKKQLYFVRLLRKVWVSRRPLVLAYR